MKKRKRIILFGILLGIIAAAWIFWPRPQLILHTTSVWNARGRNVRVSLLIPNGWVEERVAPDGNSDLVGFSYRAFAIQPSREPDWKPLWLRKLLGEGSHKYACIGINFNIGVTQRDLAEGITQLPVRKGLIADRSIDIATGCVVDYESDDPNDFKGLCREILDSAKVIRIAESGK